MMDEALVETFLFTDIEGSTRTWHAAPDAMNEGLATHDRILRDTIEAHGGRVVKGTGDGVLAAFETPRACVAAAVDAQGRLLESVPFRVRMAIATGEAHERGGDWFGPALSRCARLLDAAHGSQVLAAASTASLVRDLQVPDVGFVDLGEHTLRDIPGSQPVYQVVAPGLPERHPPLRTASTPRNNLPAARTSLIGREAELRELEGEVARARLLTITGVGGVGKTRLALELASRCVSRYAGGTFLAELASVTDGGAVPRTVADAVGLQTGALAAKAEEQLAVFFADRRALLVLDNCEHLLDSTAALVDDLLDACPSLTIVATSREPLTVDGEQVWRVPSLTTDGEQPEAVRLFVERAEAVQRDVRSLDPGVVEGICRRLDGIPLAIELAAAQIAHLPVDEIAARLNQRFSLLTGGRRRVQRQQTLLAAVEWSHELLTSEERTLLRRLAVFASWFSLDAVDLVCQAGLSEPVIRLIGSLVRKSLITADPTAPRYRLLETIRLFAEDRLVAAGEAEGLRRRHGDWVFERTRVEPDYTFDAAEIVAAVADDLRAALEWSLAAGDVDRALQGMAQAVGYWSLAGRHAEGIAFLEALDPSSLDVYQRALRHELLAVLLLPSDSRGRVEEEVQAIVALLPDPCSRSRKQGAILMAMLLISRDPVAAVELLDGVIDCDRDDPSSFHARNARDNRAHVTLAIDPVAAVREWESLFGSVDPVLRRWDDFFVLYHLGAASHLVGDHARALAMADELDRRGFSTGRSFVTYAASFLRVLGHAGLGDAAAARDAARSMTEEILRGAGLFAIKDCAIACASILIAEGNLIGASAMLGAARGPEAELRPQTVISGGLHREYTIRLRRTRPDDEETRSAYQRARTSDVRALVEAELGPVG